MLRIPHCLDNWFIDGGKVVSLNALTTNLLPRNIFISASDAHFYQSLSKLQGLVRLEGLGKVIKTNQLIPSHTCHILAYSMVP
jgi:hypothetical protein